jgi:uncharacterized spore protein YtfJ
VNIADVIANAKDSLTVQRVFGTPLERDGITVVPAAMVAGGGGAGTGQDDKGQQGEGGGFGVAARPAGAYVLSNGTLTWRPAVDVNRVITVLGAVVAVYLLMRPRVIRARTRATSAS